MDPAFFPNETLAEFYRFALLLTGHAHSAQRLLAECLVEGEMAMSQMRTVESRKAWLAVRLRQRSPAAPDGAPCAPRLLREEDGGGDSEEIISIEAYILAQHFSRLPEPERSALALHYLNLLPLRVIADLLEKELDEVALILREARERLQASLTAQQSLLTPV